MQGERRRWAPRVSQRSHETRRPAVRALILYPLNALVEDQLGRLRVGFDRSEARTWLDDHRNGNRFYFGRYTGRTPVSGNRSSKRGWQTQPRITEGLQEPDIAAIRHLETRSVWQDHRNGHVRGTNLRRGRLR